jgi:colanic acid/amylovoran biosynthesis glycosyltransferase
MALTLNDDDQLGPLGQKRSERPSECRMGPMILQLVSTFPALSETFVMREMRQLRSEGWNLLIGMLRPLHHNSPARGFEDLAPFVSQATWVSVDMFAGILFFLVLQPGRVWQCLKLVSKSIARPSCIPKMLYTLFSSMRLAFRFRNSPPALIRAHFLHTEALAARFIGELLKIPYGVTVYTVFVLYPKDVIQEIIERAAFLIADTNQVKIYLESLGADPDRVTVLYNSVSIEEFPVRSRRVSQDPPIILGVGRLDPKKGFHVLLSACSVLSSRGVKYHCVIAGEGSEHKRLEAMRQRLGLHERVELLGKLYFEEIQSWYYRADIFAMPSVVTSEGETDGLPTVVVEAMASGLPVVGTTTAAIPEAVEEGVNGFLVPSNDPNALADRLQILLEQKELRERLGCEGRQIAEVQFHLKRKVERLSDLIREYLCSIHKTSSTSLESQAV